jgi:hypothetical protein
MATSSSVVHPLARDASGGCKTLRGLQSFAASGWTRKARGCKFLQYTPRGLAPGRLDEGNRTAFKPFYERVYRGRQAPISRFGTDLAYTLDAA